MAEPEPMLGRVVVPNIRNTLVPRGRRRFPRRANLVQGVLQNAIVVYGLSIQEMIGCLDGVSKGRWCIRTNPVGPIVRRHRRRHHCWCGCLEPRRARQEGTCQQDGSTRKHHRGRLLFARLRDTTETLDFT
jgi:hypothetical protein